MSTITQKWLTENVGKPSGKWGSKYSAIYKKTGEYERQKTKQNLERLLTMVNAWSYSSHSGAKTPSAVLGKEKQQRFLNEFAYALKVERLKLNPGYVAELKRQIKDNPSDYPREKQIVNDVIGDMMISGNLLIKNTGIGASKLELTMSLSTNVAGSMSCNGILTVNPLVTKNKSQLIGLLVHEYHHYLCNCPFNSQYVDEFVAHWKEYSVTKPDASESVRVEQINSKLQELYPRHVERWKETGFGLVTSIRQVGSFLIQDNATAKGLRDNVHTIPRLT